MIFWHLRVLSFYMLISIYVISYFLVIFLPVIFARCNYKIKYKSAEIFSYGFIYILKFCCSIKYQVIGLEKLPVDTPYVVLANHQSFWENVFFQLIIPIHSWVIKKELFNIPFLGWGLQMMDLIAVDRSNKLSIVQIINQGKKKLRQNISIIIFPESTRLLPRETRPFKPSGIKLATAAKVPMVLIAHNAGCFWPKGYIITKPGTITVEIIDVIYPSENLIDVRVLTNEIQEKINFHKNQLTDST